jgi:hypothetical protein
MRAGIGQAVRGPRGQQHYDRPFRRARVGLNPGDYSSMLFIRRLFRASSSALPPFSRPMSTAIPRDVQAFLDDYPGQRDDPSLRANLEFYTGTRRCEPDGLLIDDLHQRCVYASSPRG